MIGKIINIVLGKEGDKREFWIGLKKGDGELSWKAGEGTGKKEDGGVWKSWPNFIFGCRVISEILGNAWYEKDNKANPMDLEKCQKECFTRRNTFRCSVVEHVDAYYKGWDDGSQSMCRLKACGWNPTPKVEPDYGFNKKFKGYSFIPNTYENWGDKEPSNTTGKNCVKMKQDGGEQGPIAFTQDRYGEKTYSYWPVNWWWFQEKCNAKHLYICERGEKARQG